MSDVLGTTRSSSLRRERDLVGNFSSFNPGLKLKFPASRKEPHIPKHMHQVRCFLPC